MRFVCLVHVDLDLISKLTPEEDAALQLENYELDQAYLKSGKLIAAGPLEFPEKATLIRSRNGQVTVNDGPYVETKEHLGGFMLIDAESREEAIKIASGSMEKYGTLELRETWELPDPRLAS